MSCVIYKSKNLDIYILYRETNSTGTLSKRISTVLIAERPGDVHVVRRDLIFQWCNHIYYLIATGILSITHPILSFTVPSLYRRRPEACFISWCTLSTFNHPYECPVWAVKEFLLRRNKKLKPWRWVTRNISQHSRPKHHKNGADSGIFRTHEVEWDHPIWPLFFELFVHASCFCGREMGVGEAVIQLGSDVVVGHIREQAKISKAGYQRCRARQTRD